MNPIAAIFIQSPTISEQFVLLTECVTVKTAVFGDTYQAARTTESISKDYGVTCYLLILAAGGTRFYSYTQDKWKLLYEERSPS